jgi:hypothetical protein
MGRTVGDVRTLYKAMRGEQGDAGSGRAILEGPKRIRIGVLEAYFRLEENDPPEELILENGIVQSIARNALATIQASDVTIELVPIDPTTYPDWSVSTLLATVDTQPFEFKDCLERFLQSPGISSPHRTLLSIVQSEEYDKNAVTDVFYASLKDPQTCSRTSMEYETRLSKIANLKESVHNCFEENNLDALVYPHQRQLAIKVGPTVQPRRNGVLAALTGNPAICLPGEFLQGLMGFQD